MLTKLGRTDLHLIVQMNNLYQNIIDNECKLQRKIILSQLQTANTDPLEFAYIYNNGPGAIASVAGKVIYVAGKVIYV